MTQEKGADPRLSQAPSPTPDNDAQAAFEVHVGGPSPRIVRIWADGRVQGFEVETAAGVSVVAFNRIPLLLAKAREEAAEKATEETAELWDPRYDTSQS